MRLRHNPQPDFQGSTRHPWTQQELLRSLPRPKPILSSKEFQGLGGLCRKDNSPQSSGGRLRLISRCRVGTRAGSVPLSGWGIRTSFPFGRRCGLYRKKTPLYCIRFPLSLRIDWLVSNSCSHETLLHIGPPGPLWSICYYHQDSLAASGISQVMSKTPTCTFKVCITNNVQLKIRYKSN